MNTLVGPMIETQRVVVPGTQTYVEIRNEFHDESAWCGYIIETGHVIYGHRGSWGRDNIREATACFESAIEYAATHHVVTPDPATMPTPDPAPVTTDPMSDFADDVVTPVTITLDLRAQTALRLALSDRLHWLDRLGITDDMDPLRLNVVRVRDMLTADHSNCLDPGKGVHAIDCPTHPRYVTELGVPLDDDGTQIP